MSAQVRRLFLKAGKGQSMVSSSAVEAVAGFGLKGDASYGRRSRQILLIDMETLKDFDLEAGDVRENITTAGLDFSRLVDGSRLLIGPVLLETTGECSPCSMLDDLRPGLQKAIDGRRGILAKVVSGGSISIGDQISYESAAEGA